MTAELTSGKRESCGGLEVCFLGFAWCWMGGREGLYDEPMVWEMDIGSVFGCDVHMETEERIVIRVDDVDSHNTDLNNTGKIASRDVKSTLIELELQ